MSRNPFSGDMRSADARLDTHMAVRRAEREREQKETERKRIEQERQEILEAAHQKAKDFFDEEGAIQPDTFTLYDPRMIRRDMTTVSQLERKFTAQEKDPTRHEQQKLALVLEAIIHEQIELCDWLGPDATTRKASRFDDIVNGVDSIAEFSTEEARRHLALAMDVTYTKQPEQKLQRIKTEIDRGSLTNIKYFESSDHSYKGTLSKVPRVLIGVDPARIIDLARLWLTRDTKTLAEHPIQIQILEEITFQLEFFRDYAKRHRQPAIAEILDKNLRLVQAISLDPQKRMLAERPGSRTFIDQDRVYRMLRASMQLFKQ